ncbi:MAG: GTPase [Phycisphaerae bacterium]
MTVDDPTCAALLTPLVPGAVATIGLSGPQIDPIFDRLLRMSRGGVMRSLQLNRPVRCRIVDGTRVIDDAVVVRLEKNGRACAEINTHGGVRIVQRVLRLLENHGAKILEDQAYYKWVQAGDRIEMDADRALIAAGSRRLAEWLLVQRKILPKFLANCGSLDETTHSAFLERSRAAIRLIDGLQVALIGPPNAGKSSLANRLIGRDRAITSNEPGTTRDWVSETALISGWPVTLTDTAGLRETTCPIEVEAIRRTRVQAQSADAVVIVLDATQSANDRRAEAERIVASLPDGCRALAVNNQCDLPDAEETTFGSIESCEVSALTGEGVGALEDRLCSILGLNLLDATLPTAFMRKQIDRSSSSCIT